MNPDSLIEYEVQRPKRQPAEIYTNVTTIILYVYKAHGVDIIKRMFNT